MVVDHNPQAPVNQTDEAKQELRRVPAWCNYPTPGFEIAYHHVWQCSHKIRHTQDKPTRIVLQSKHNLASTHHKVKHHHKRIIHNKTKHS